MQWYNTATKNLETKISSNLESLNFQTCNDIKLQLPNLEIKIASINKSALSMQILWWRQTIQFSFSFFFQFFHFRVYNSIGLHQININIDDQVAWAPSNQNFAIQLKGVTREKFKVFVIKVATLGIHLIILWT